MAALRSIRRRWKSTSGQELIEFALVLPLLLPSSSQDSEEMIEVARRAARERGWPDMRAVFVSHGDFYASTIVDQLGHAADGLVRAGCACYTTDDEIERLLAGVREIASGA
jgi:hypothetical protein